MIQFLVTVICSAHIHNCPLPKAGYHSTYPARSKEICERTARAVIAAYGYPAKDFVIVCETK